jgi:Dolichyl-phosphate-mannose-protein mannosyltransferase
MGTRAASELGTDGRALTLLVLVILQCILYGTNLKQLPMWGDEAFTVQTVAEAPARIVELVRVDIHPPLYFLLAHWWNRLPIGDSLVRLRALSVLFAVLTTFFLDLCWLRNASPSLRNWFMLFWTFSPCLLLYSRMARSYSMQMFLATVAIWCLLRFVEDDAGWKNLAAFVAALAALLYTHYLPGIAVWAGANLLLIMQLRRGRSIWKAWLLPNALVAVLYLPWLVTLSGALHQWRVSEVYSLTGNRWAEQMVKLAYWYYSFTFGEASSVWLLPVTVVIALPVLWMLFWGTRLRTDWLWSAFFAATIGFLGATRWVAYPAMPARLLFLLPLFLVALAAGVTAKQRAGMVLGVIVLALNVAGLWTYYGAKDLLNTGYMVPSQTIAAEIAQHSHSEDTVVWIDATSFDGSAIEYYLPKSFRMRWLVSPESVAAARTELDAGSIRHVWIVRRSRDISPGHVIEQLESEMTQRWTEPVQHPYVPLSPVHRVILRVIAPIRDKRGDQAKPYMCEVSEFRNPR